MPRPMRFAGLFDAPACSSQRASVHQGGAHGQTIQPRFGRGGGSKCIPVANGGHGHILHDVVSAFRPAKPGDCDCTKPGTMHAQRFFGVIRVHRRRFGFACRNPRPAWQTARPFWRHFHWLITGRHAPPKVLQATDTMPPCRGAFIPPAGALRILFYSNQAVAIVCGKIEKTPFF